LLAVVFARLLALKIIAVLLLAGCAKNPLVAPSGGAVTGGLSRAETGLTQAQAQQVEIAKQNAEARRTADRIDAKDKFLQDYRKWKATRP
jgi:hypothetical protein